MLAQKKRIPLTLALPANFNMKVIGTLPLIIFGSVVLRSTFINHWSFKFLFLLSFRIFH